MCFFFFRCCQCKSRNVLNIIDTFHQFIFCGIENQSEQMTMHMIVIISPPEYMFVIQQWHECVYPFLIGDTVFRIYKRIKGFVSIYLQFAYTFILYKRNCYWIMCGLCTHTNKYIYKNYDTFERSPIRQIDESNEWTIFVASVKLYRQDEIMGRKKLPRQHSYTRK